MIEIEKPRIDTEELSSDGKYGRFVVEPLERGFGNTRPPSFIFLSKPIASFLIFIIAKAAMKSTETSEIKPATIMRG